MIRGGVVELLTIHLYVFEVVVILPSVLIFISMSHFVKYLF